MAVNVAVKKNNQESTANLIRRFTKRVQGSGVLNRVRKGRYHTRTKSEQVNRARKLIKLEKKVKYETLLKLGKVQEKPTRGRR